MGKRQVLSVLLFLAMVSTMALAQSAPDPTRLSVGSRYLGMGKAFVGLADDVGSIYLNPAGLGNVTRWQVASMQGKLLEEFNYVNFSGVYPTTFGNFGLGISDSRIGNAPVTKKKDGCDDEDPVYEIDPTAEAMSYVNDVFVISYGNKLANITDKIAFTKDLTKRIGWLNTVNIGANLKLFSTGLSGDSITQGSASGMELDLGIHARPMNFLGVGVNLQNALPMSMGGKLVYASGWEENYPAVLKLGAAVNVLGPDDMSLRSIGDQRLKLAIDADMEPTRTQVPMIMHLGAEWMPLDLIAIRAGIDQDMAGVGVVASNLTAGVGLYYQGLRFDYAYHQFAGAPGESNHFFSLCYGIFLDKTKKARNYFDITSPPDKTVTTDSKVVVKVQKTDPDVFDIRIKGWPVMALGKTNSYEAEATLEATTKNTIWVEAFDKKGVLLQAKRVRLLKLIGYPDVPKTYWANEQVSYIGTMGIIKGYPDGGFKPEGNITRAEMSALLTRTKASGEANVPPANLQLFSDVKVNHWAAKYINLAAKTGIVKGYPNGSFKPSANITRAEGLAMVARFGSVKEITTTTTRSFMDVAANYWAAPIISGAFTEGMLKHFEGKPFEPNKKLNRAESVELLFRSAPVKALVGELKDFERGYELISPAQKLLLPVKK